jgi:hypothetical protein
MLQRPYDKPSAVRFQPRDGNVNADRADPSAAVGAGIAREQSGT